MTASDWTAKALDLWFICFSVCLNILIVLYRCFTKLFKIRVKNRAPVPSYQMDHNESDMDGSIVSVKLF